MRVLLVGGGGREHALALSLAASPRVEALLAAPGSDAIAELATCFAIPADNVDRLCNLAKEQGVELVVIGPEAPLAAGLVDALEEAGITAFGPSAAAARLESSKSFMKAFAARHGIPTAACRSFPASQAEAARNHVRAHELPVVIKADGLAAGKGVTVAASREEALAALDAAFSGSFGTAGDTVVVEAFLEGEEASFFALCDGQNAVPFGTAQDHKRAFDGDRGPNTGGMGAYSPAPIVDGEMEQRIMQEIVLPTVNGMREEGHPFRGFLYAGLMIGVDGPKLVEFNVRLGDPEAQVILPRLESDLVDFLERAATGRLAGYAPNWSDRHALTVVMAADGYPSSYAKGEPIGGLCGLDDEHVTLFHAGTRRADMNWITNGGRVLAITGRGKSLADAHARAYDAVAKIDWQDAHYRRDIGTQALTRQRG